MSNQEEDATDLNFPKDGCCINQHADFKTIFHPHSWNESSNDSTAASYVAGLRCGKCHTLLKYPHIECDECPNVLRIVEGKVSTTPVLICLECFSLGAEFDGHANSHKFVVVRNNFPYMNNNWTTADELSFLDALKICGIGNWDTVSKRLSNNKTPSECKDHFSEVFTRETNKKMNHNHMVPYIDGLEDPPRPSVLADAYYYMGGYNAARADFEVEHDQQAEKLITEIEFPSKADKDDNDELYERLVHSVLETYQTRLKERYRRKKTIRRHGLISEAKTFVHRNRGRAYLPTSLATLFPKLHQLMSSRALCQLIESFKLESELQERVRSLQRYRHNGLTKLCSATVFEELQDRQAASIRERRARVVIGSNGDSSNSLTLVQDPTGKRSSIPLDIVARAGYDKLDDAERKLASDIRLLPVDFIRFKNAMIAECKKQKGITLAQARLLIKIDVNKTRRLYDLLLSKNEIFV